MLRALEARARPHSLHHVALWLVAALGFGSVLMAAERPWSSASFDEDAEEVAPASDPACSVPPALRHLLRSPRPNCDEPYGCGSQNESASVALLMEVSPRALDPSRPFEILLLATPRARSPLRASAWPARMRLRAPSLGARAAAWQELILKVENEVTSASVRPAAAAASFLPTGDTSGDKEMDSHRASMDLDEMAAAEGFARRSELPLAPPSQTTMGVVLGVAAQADELARKLDDDPEVSKLLLDEASAPAAREPEQDAKGGVRRGGYGGMKKGARAPRTPAPPPTRRLAYFAGLGLSGDDGAPPRLSRPGVKTGGETAQLRLASWSESDGLREATFIKKRAGPASAAM